MIPRSLESRIRYLKSPGQSALEEANSIESTVKSILVDVKNFGDQALKDLSKKFDKINIESFEVSQEDRRSAVINLDRQTRADTEFAIENVQAFAQAQLSTLQPLEVERERVQGIERRIVSARKEHQRLATAILVVASRYAVDGDVLDLRAIQSFDDGSSGFHECPFPGNA